MNGNSYLSVDDSDYRSMLIISSELAPKLNSFINATYQAEKLAAVNNKSQF